ncbi:hypothetical protein N7457_003655 [Penicillium paradoxum]|uniref:uncharacterized protein n=1 Tax=Penicillium paradoxum TaxID=176176 RepID=UPI002546F02C|nr:uncharacterized protein N7457_003655 [Penicillium paradoxum]KAJ5788665.1 hypothetical protein N7457_003655 [Penicillium paradoxum]
MPVFLEGARTPCSTRQAATKRGTGFSSSHASTATVFVRLFSPSNQQTDVMSQISQPTEFTSPKAQSTRRQLRMPLTGSPRRAPLQQTLNPPQPGVTTIDVPGRGGGKENIPPGRPTEAKGKNKSDDPPLVPGMTRRVVQNATPRKPATSKTKETCKVPGRVALGETRGNIVRVPQKQVRDTPARDSRISRAKRTLSAVVIQRAWRSYAQRRNDHVRASAIAKVKTEWACEVITRWWRMVKVRKLRQEAEQMEQMEQPQQIEQVKHTKQKPRCQSAAQRTPVRKSCGRRGIRRL